MITNIPNLGMNYVNYKTAIVQKYHVQLLGWPSDLPFVNPHQLTTSAAARTLQNALTVATCKWVVMSKRQQQEHAAALAADLQVEGGQAGKKRKPRCDKGKKRKHTQPLADANDDNDTDEDEEDTNDENERPMPAKRQKLAASGKKATGHASKLTASSKTSKSKPSKAAAARKAKRVARALPPAAFKSKEIIDTEDDSDD
jgi:hypothetical protein